MRSLRERTEIQQAYLDGKQIESVYLGSNNQWAWACYGGDVFDWSNYDFRIKREPMVRWINIYDEAYTADVAHITEQRANCSLSQTSKGKTVKFIEVID